MQKGGTMGHTIRFNTFAGIEEFGFFSNPAEARSELLSGGWTEEQVGSQTVYKLSFLPSCYAHIVRAHSRSDISKLPRMNESPTKSS